MPMMLPRIGALLSTSLLVLSAPIAGGSQQSETTTVTYTASVGERGAVEFPLNSQ